MNVYYWIQANRTKWNLVWGIIALIIFIVHRNGGFWFGFSSAFLFVDAIYFIWLGVEKIKNNKKEDIAE